MNLPITEKFKEACGKLNLTEQGQQVYARMRQHLEEYERGAGEPSSLFGEQMHSVLGRVWPVEKEKPYPKEVTVEDKALETMSNMYFDLLLTYWTKTVPGMDEVCKNCGATYGEHRHVDEVCPDPKCETRDITGGWLTTKFKK